LHAVQELTAEEKVEKEQKVGVNMTANFVPLNALVLHFDDFSFRQKNNN
jgi:hypothetical protein